MVCRPAAPPPLAERVELCWQMAERLRAAEALPLQPPDWLAVLEQQLVQDGATLSIDLLQELEEAGAQAAPATRARAVRLLARLERLLAPAPEWVLRLARQQLEQQVRLVLAAGPEPRALAELAELVELVPVPADRQPALAAALTRLRLGLELLEPQLAPLASPPQAEASQSEGSQFEGSQPAASQPAPQPASAAGPELAELVLLEPGGSAGPLQLDLAPQLAAEPEAIEAALDDFVWHLPRGSRALPAATALQALLEPRWRQGLRLPVAAFERLAYLAASWQRRLGDRLEPLPALDWQHSLLLELGAMELAVLQPLLADPAGLEPVLAELRREHHNPAFWQRQELPWMQCPPPLEALRRLHLEEGYYARAHAPLAELASWGEAAAQALLQAELWTNDAGCLGRWLAVAQELVLRHGQPLPPLGAPPAPERLLAELGGLEVVYVGERAAAVQAAHRQGLCFRGEPFGLRVVEMPASRWPARPAGGFGESLALLLEVVDGLYRQRPFALLLADCGAYRLPLLREAHQRYGVAALSSGRPLAGWLGA